MPKAKSREEYITTWNEHIDQLSLIALTMDTNDYEMMKEINDCKVKLKSLVKTASVNIDK